MLFTDRRNKIDKKEFTFDQIQQRLSIDSIKLVDGGKWFRETNDNCSAPTARYNKIAFIIPYRDRLRNLKIFLNNMHPFFVRHGINYGIYLIEPIAEITFNRGLLMNIGFLEVIKDSYTINGKNNSTTPYWDCFIFHDVDMIPEMEILHYTCDSNYPIHYAVAVSKFGYRYYRRSCTLLDL